MPDKCEMPRDNATTDEIRAMLTNLRVIAVVGLSDKADRDSHKVAEYMQQHGYRIIPVNPAATEILGEKSYATLADIPEKVDIVDVFRKPDAVPEIADAAIAIGAKVLWLQEGIVHNEAAAKAKAAGLEVVQSKCVLKEHWMLNAHK